MTDRYEFEKSVLPQGVEEETPYSSKNWNFIQDINNGSYTSGSGLALTQFDLSSIFNSSKMVDPSQAYLAIPITYCTAWTNSSGTTLAPLKNAWASTGLKNGYFQLIQGLDLTVAGKVVEQFVPNLNQYVGFKMLSQMCQDDLKGWGASLGMGEVLDNYESMTYTPNGVASVSGSAVNALTPASVANGIANNTPFPLNIPVTTQATAATGFTGTSVTLSASNTAIAVGQLITGAGVSPNTYVSAISGTTLTLSQSANIPAVAITLSFYNSLGSDMGDQAVGNIQYSGTYNNGYFSRLKRIPDTTQTGTNGYSNMIGTSNCITNASNLAKEFRPYFTVQSNIAYWYDVAIIRCCDILDSMKKLPLMKKFDAQMRLYLNVGSVVSNVATNGYQVVSGSSITFTNTCPLIQSALQVYPANTSCMTSALFIGSPQTTAISVNGGTVNFSGNAHFMNACRFYFPQIDLKPEKLDMYISSNRSKKVCFTSILNNTFTAISSGSTSSFLVQSGVSNIKGVLIMPYVASTVNGNTGSTYTTTFSQVLSPFDTAPATTAPISLINLQVAVGGVNQLANVYSYSYEHFLQQVGLVEKINAGDLGLSCGLMNQAWWEQNRMYYIDLSRCNPADLLTPRNITISFTNNSNVTIDVQVFTEYLREIALDVETGLITM
jgi:hypothetical protein